MKVVIFGATGSIGRHLVEQARRNGDAVTGFARSAQKSGPGLTWVQGDVRDFAAVTNAVRGQDAVLCALGAGARGGIRADGTANIIRAMQQTGVRRLICQSTLGAGDSVGNLNFFWKYLMFGFLLRAAYADHQRQEEHVRSSGLDWTIVRPSAFTDGPLTGNYRHGFPGSGVARLNLKISRADVAHFMRRQLSDHQYLHRTPGLSY